MYLIAACLPGLRPLIIRLHASLSASFSSLLELYHGSSDPSSSPSPKIPGLSPRNRHLAPKIDVKLTGQGNLDSLNVEKEDEDAVDQSPEYVTHG